MSTVNGPLNSAYVVDVMVVVPTYVMNVPVTVVLVSVNVLHLLDVNDETPKSHFSRRAVDSSCPNSEVNACSDWIREFIPGDSRGDRRFANVGGGSSGR